MSDDLERVERALARQVTPQVREGVIERRHGVIDAVNTDGTVDVTVGGVIIPGVRYKAWYRPVAADSVFVEVVGTDFVVDGPLSSAGGTAGTLGYAEVSANQGSITSEADLSGLSVTVRVGTARRIEITGWAYFKSTVPSDTIDFRIKEGATQLKSAQRDGGWTFANSAYVVWVGTPSAGLHTYKLTALRSVGSGTVTMNVADFGAGYTAFILVKDIGPA